MKLTVDESLRRKSRSGQVDEDGTYERISKTTVTQVLTANMLLTGVGLETASVLVSGKCHSTHLKEQTTTTSCRSMVEEKKCDLGTGSSRHACHILVMIPHQAIKPSSHQAHHPAP